MTPDKAAAAVDQFEPEYWKAVGDPRRFGLAKELLGALRERGIDPRDEPAVDAFLEEYNSRLRP